MTAKQVLSLLSALLSFSYGCTALDLEQIESAHCNRTGRGDTWCAELNATNEPCVMWICGGSGYCERRTTDADGDMAIPDGCAAPGQPIDCDDGNASIRPGSPEVCDAIDQDCDGIIDENTLALTSSLYDPMVDPVNSAAVQASSVQEFVSVFTREDFTFHAFSGAIEMLRTPVEVQLGAGAASVVEVMRLRPDLTTPLYALVYSTGTDTRVARVSLDAPPPIRPLEEPRILITSLVGPSSIIADGTKVTFVHAESGRVGPLRVSAFDAADRASTIVRRDVGARAAAEAPALAVIGSAMYIGYVEDGAIIVARAALMEGIPREFRELYRVTPSGTERTTVALDGLAGTGTEPVRLGVAWLEGIGASMQVAFRIVVLDEGGPGRSEFEGMIGSTRARQSLSLRASPARREWLVVSTASNKMLFHRLRGNGQSAEPSGTETQELEAGAGLLRPLRVTSIEGGYAGIATQPQTGTFVPFALTCEPR